MAVDIDKSMAMKLLNASYLKCLKKSVESCVIKDTIDFVMSGKNCLTYRYIMFTALLAKAVEPTVNILALQAGDVLEGSYDARSLASKVVFPFQQSMLGNILDGSNSDPLVNKPGRFPRLRKSNPAAAGDPKKALTRLCDDLPKVHTSQEARMCVDYIVSLLLTEKTNRDNDLTRFHKVARGMSAFHVYRFMSDLLDQGFGGSALVLVTTALYHLKFPENEYLVLPHPVNQSGSSKRQFSDLDVFRNDAPFMGTELKDRPFTSSDVDHAAEVAYQAGASGLLFIAGRQSNFAAQPPSYFAHAREKYARKGIYVGVTSIDALMDTVFTCHMELNAAYVLGIVRDTAEAIGALEAQMWIYQHITDLF